LGDQVLLIVGGGLRFVEQAMRELVFQLTQRLAKAVGGRCSTRRTLLVRENDSGAAVVRCRPDVYITKS
jgi:hypothetical protein